MVASRKIPCPSCGVRLRIAESLPAGKAIQCPKCETRFRVPDEKPELAAARAVLARTHKPVKRSEPEEEEGYEEEERPRKKVKKKKKKQSGNPLLLVCVALGGLILVCAGVTLAVVFWPSGKKSDTVAAAPNAGNNPRAGESAELGSREGAQTPDQELDRRMAGNGSAGGDAVDSARGQQIFQESCLRCHALGNLSNPDGGRRRGGRAPDLSHVGQDPSHTAAWLEKFIRDPKAVNPNAHMPGFQGKMSDADLKTLAVYLASLK